MAEIRCVIKKYRKSAIRQYFNVHPAFAELDYHSDQGKTRYQLFNTHQKYHNFLDNLQTQLTGENKAEVAKLVSYPIEINIDGKKVKIKTPQQLIKLYGAIFTPALMNTVNTQQYKDLFINAQGVMIGNGQIWFSDVCGDNQCKKSTVLITAINK